ncbi:putative bifunctional diguanylate cyclase/phosphodiesterase [Blastococcus sp. SYSU D00820]
MHLSARWSRRTPTRGVPLSLHLLALVLIPLAGVVVLTGVIVRSQQAEAASAADAEEAVRAMAQLDAARNGVEHEIVPAMCQLLVQDPVAAAQLGIPPLLVATMYDELVAAAEESRAATDAALAAVPAGSVGAEAAERATARLADLRAAVDGGNVPVEDLYFDYLDISNTLMHAQRQAAAAASSQEVPAATLRATRDVEIVSQLSQTASRLFPLFLAGQLDAGELAAGSRLAGESAFLAYQDAQRQMADLSQAELIAAWQVTRTDPLTVSLDALYTAQADGSLAPLAVPDLIPLLTQAPARDSQLNALVERAVGSAQALTSADRAHAQDVLERMLLTCAGLLLVALLVAVLLGRRVARSLRQLADQARRVSEGSLVAVEVAGPREVQTVSTALESAVASLRRIQDQAAAVARGDLDDALLDQPLPGPLGEVVHASVKQIVTSVRQREELQFALAHQATHDPLTELPNRAQALTLVTSALHRGARSGEMTGLLFIDLDGFKAVNDGHGHAAGDEVLRTVAARMTASVRPGDVVCRLGGDEFVVLVEQVQDEHDLMGLAERLITAISAPVAVEDAGVRVGASIGVAVSRDGGTDADLLFAEADTAAYRAKAHGRGRAEIFDETLRAQLDSRAELEAAIAAALTNGEMHLHYQPVMDVGTDRLMGYEALIRWDRPGVGMVPPDQFIPVAEGSGLICDLDRWVLGEATRQLAEWRATEPAATDEPEPTMAVNISGRHLADRRVVADVADALAAAGLPSRLLVVEVTETVLVTDPLAIGHLAALREMGVGIAIDDFGTGYTSIGQLRHMPVDTLKIDRSFVASDDAGHRELVALMIRAAHTFGLTVVAEGVEEPDQLARLRDDACDHAQGYLLHRPLPAADAGALLRGAPVLPVG